MKLRGYSVGDPVWEEPGAVVFAGVEEGTQRRVLVRRPRVTGQAGIDRLRRDYEIALSLPQELVVTPISVERFEGGAALVLEDDGARPLRQVLAAQRLDLIEVLDIVAGLTTVVGQLHAKQIIHKNLTPHSVWYDRANNRVRLTDFGLAGRVAEEGYQIPIAGQIDGLLTHLSPEQTGRLVRVVDHRADHYSIGIILFQLLVGRLPFSSADPLQLVHAHLARRPTPPHELDPAIPEAVSGIVMKLLAKAPDERYQSAFGLRADLRECLTQLRSTSRVQDFVPGERDSFETFQISQTLYGRDQARELLAEAFERTSAGAVELVLVKGAPGSGKSVLVNELQKTVAAANGHYITGKFDQYRQDVPYSGIVHALKELVGQILSRSDMEMAAWKHKLLSALGTRGQVLIDVIPALELITGPCPPVPRLPVEEDRNRFDLVFRDFARILPDEEEPLVLFLDDLQWVDAGSLSLLRLLLTGSSMSHLLVVAAYRTGEAPPGHRLRQAIESLESDGVSVLRVDLEPLAVEDVQALIDDTLRCGDLAALALAELVHRKTDGNPFFVNQFLQFLHDDGLLFFDHESARWSWDLRQIESEGITEDVVHLMTRRIARLTPEGQRTLALAAFLGTEFTLRTTATVCERDRASVLEDLRSAQREGLLVGRLDRSVGSSSDTADDDVTFRFLHDRVQQASFALVERDQRPPTHLLVGKRLLASMSEEELAVAPFEVVNNWNLGVELVKSSVDRQALAKLNLLAARKAQETTAYDAALEYLSIGISLLDQASWTTDYELAYEIHLRWLQVAFVTGSFELADRAFEALQEAVEDPIDRAYVANQKILIDTASERSEEAIRFAVESLRSLGVRIPLNPNRLHVIRELARNKLMVGRRRPTDLVSLPVMDDRKRQAALQLLKVVSVPAYIQNPSLMALVAARIVSLSARHGNGPPSPQGYVLHGLVVGSFLGDYQGGFEYGRAAVTLSADFDDLGVRCNALYVFAGFISIWVRPLGSSLELLDDAYRLAVDAGHIDYAVYSVLSQLFTHMAMGTPLDELRAIADRHQPFVEQSKNDFAVMVDVTRAWIQALQEGPRGAHGSTQAFGGSELDHDMRATPNATKLVQYLIHQLQLAYHMGDYETAASAGREAEKHIDRVLGQIIFAEHYFYSGLTAAAMVRRQPEDKSKWMRILKRSARKFRKWTRHSAENFEDKLLLLEAELASITDAESSLARYDRGITSAERYGFTQNAAIGNELAGRRSLGLGRRTVAQVYLKGACASYARWGASGKVRMLSEEFPDFGLAPDQIEHAEDRSSPSAGDSMDLDSVLKTAQTIAGEGEIDVLLERLLSLVLENAGAERGCVLVSREGRLLIEAEGSVDGTSTKVLQATPAQTSDELCYPIVQFVARTKGDLVLDDARADARFSADPYVLHREPKSVLCSPVLKQGEVIGLLYLENNLTTGAFTPERVQVLQLIASDVAISIDNARLSENLEESSANLEAAKSKVDVLEKAKTELSKFVPASVQRAIDANPDAPELQKRDADVSVLFLDIAGYTRMCEVLGTDRAHDTVQRYFSSYLADITDNGGEIAETAGDGLMILFQNPDPATNAADAARAALAIGNKTRDLNLGRRDDSESVVVNIGINSGLASLGATRFESAAGTRYTYTASGSTTNLAARVGASATDGSILVTTETAGRIGAGFHVTDRGEQNFKNIPNPVRVFSLDGEKSG